METKKQRIFYRIGFLVVVGVFIAFGKDIASIEVIALVGLDICSAREKRRLLGLLLMIPFRGIVNGLIVPVMLVPHYLLFMSDQWETAYQFAVYGVLAVLLIVFYIKGRNWRAWFRENMKHRSLRLSEKCLLWLVGILMMLFANAGVIQIVAGRGSEQTASGSYGSDIMMFIGISSMAAFIMIITIIVMIMQDNKRSFYHEKVSNMQSGMITFMAEVVENRDDNTGGHIILISIKNCTKIRAKT